MSRAYCMKAEPVQIYKNINKIFGNCSKGMVQESCTIEFAISVVTHVWTMLEILNPLWDYNHDSPTYIGGPGQKHTVQDWRSKNLSAEELL